MTTITYAYLFGWGFLLTTHIRHECAGSIAGDIRDALQLAAWPITVLANIIDWAANNAAENEWDLDE